jgi:hypothetical protein
MSPDAMVWYASPPPFTDCSKHVHVLLYLARQPGLPYQHAQASPLALLYRLSALHTPRNVAGLLPIPGNPFRAPNPKENTGAWDSRGKIELEVLRLVRGCETDGIYALLWEKQRHAPVKPVRASGRRSRRIRAEESEEEAEEVERYERVVDPDAWGLVEWLIDLWRWDAETFAGEYPGRREYLTRNSHSLPASWSQGS